MSQLKKALKLASSDQRFRRRVFASLQLNLRIRDGLGDPSIFPKVLLNKLERQLNRIYSLCYTESGNPGDESQTPGLISVALFLVDGQVKLPKGPRLTQYKKNLLGGLRQLAKHWKTADWGGETSFPPLNWVQFSGGPSNKERHLKGITKLTRKLVGLKTAGYMGLDSVLQSDRSSDFHAIMRKEIGELSLLLEPYLKLDNEASSNGSLLIAWSLVNLPEILSPTKTLDKTLAQVKIGLKYYLKEYEEGPSKPVAKLLKNLNQKYKG